MANVAPPPPPPQMLRLKKKNYVQETYEQKSSKRIIDFPHPLVGYSWSATGSCIWTFISDPPPATEPRSDYLYPPVQAAPISSPPLFFFCPGQRKRRRPVPMPVTGVRYNSFFWMCTLKTRTWPDPLLQNLFNKKKSDNNLKKKKKKKKDTRRKKKKDPVTDGCNSRVVLV